MITRAHGVADRAGAVRWVLAAVALMYVSLGTVLGFVQGGLGPILRAQGLGLAAQRWVFLLFVPFGTAFLWSPWVDARRWPWLGPRTGWIATSQAVAVVLVAALAMLPPAHGHWAAMVAIGLLATAASATTDLALDGLTAELIPPAWRPAASAAKVCGLCVGSIVGGGVFVGLYPLLGWQGVLGAMAAVMLIATLPVAMLVAQDRRLAHGRGVRARAHLLAVLGDPLWRRRLLRVSLLTCTLVALFNLNRLMLVDLGVPLERIGWLLGTPSPVASALAGLLAALACRWLPMRRVAEACALVCIAAVALIMLGIGTRAVPLALAGALLIGAGISALYVVVGGLILGWAQSDRAVTDYALLYGLGRLAGTVLLIALPAWVAQIGWMAFYGVAGVAFVIALCALLPAFSTRRAAPAG